jgi:hypothetical protein
VDDGARLIVEYRVVLVFTGDRETVAATLSEAMIFCRPKVPTAWPLQEIAA